MASPLTPTPAKAWYQDNTQRGLGVHGAQVISDQEPPQSIGREVLESWKLRMTEEAVLPELNRI